MSRGARRVESNDTLKLKVKMREITRFKVKFREVCYIGVNDPVNPDSGIDEAEVLEIIEKYLADNPPMDGDDGYSPTVEVVKIEGGNRVIITDINGTTTFDVLNGKDAQSPAVEVVDIDGGHRVIITDTNGTKTFDVPNGTDGDPGISPTVSIEQIEGGHRLIITDVNGTKTVDVLNGKDGDTVIVENIDPSRVIFPNGKKTTYEFGKIKLENGIAELIPPGGNLNDFFDALIDELNPETTNPEVSLTFDQAKAYEVGTKVTPSYSASLSAGSYTYGPDTGITATAWEVADTDGNKKTTASGTFPQITVEDGENYKITAKATHGDGATPVTNTGNPYSAGQIKSGNKSATSKAITGYRNTFHGTLTAKSAITSSVVRGLTGKSNKAFANGNGFTVTIPVGALRVVIAYPATLRDLTSVKDVNGMNAEIVSGFTKQVVSVEGAGSHKAIDYKVYTMDFANANDTANKFTVTI